MGQRPLKFERNGEICFPDEVTRGAVKTGENARSPEKTSDSQETKELR